MTLIFTDEEKEWLIKEPFNWHTKDGCPKEIAESIQQKLRLLETQKTSYRYRSDRKEK